MAAHTEAVLAQARIVCAGTPEEVAACPESITGRYIAEELNIKR